MFKDPHSEFNKFLQNIFLWGAKLVHKFSYINHLAIDFGLCLHNLVRYKLLDQKLKPAIRGSRREELWKQAIKKIANRPFVGFEFGVAWGYQTDFWMRNCQSIQNWHAYDTFTGLPESWRHYDKGHFSSDGVPPKISDARIDWHIGLVETTFDVSLIKGVAADKNIFISFDLDLFRPTYFLLSQIVPELKEGDLIYFDEPHDVDEGALIHLLIMLNREKLRILGDTPCQLLFEVIKNDLVFPEYVE